MSSELTRRILFGVIAAPIVVGILFIGDAALAALLAIATRARRVGVLSHRPRDGTRRRSTNAGIVIAGLIPLLVHARYLRLYDANGIVGAMSLGALVMLLLFAAAIWARGVDGKPLGAVASTALGAAYTGGMLSFGYAIRYHDYAFAAATLKLGSWTASVPSGGLLVAVAGAPDVGVGHRRVRGRSHARANEAHSVGQSGKNRRGRDRRPRGVHDSVVGLHAVRASAGVASRFSERAVGRAGVRRAGERRGADRRPRRIAAQARGRREGQLASDSGPRRRARSTRQPLLRAAGRRTSRSTRCSRTRRDERRPSRVASRSSDRPGRSARRRCASSRASAIDFASPR